MLNKISRARWKIMQRVAKKLARTPNAMHADKFLKQHPRLLTETRNIAGSTIRPEALTKNKALDLALRIDSLARGSFKVPHKGDVGAARLALSTGRDTGRILRSLGLDPSHYKFVGTVPNGVFTGYIPYQKGQRRIQLAKDSYLRALGDLTNTPKLSTHGTAGIGTGTMPGESLFAGKFRGMNFKRGARPFVVIDSSNLQSHGGSRAPISTIDRATLSDVRAQQIGDLEARNKAYAKAMPVDYARRLAKSNTPLGDYTQANNLLSDPISYDRVKFDSPREFVKQYMEVVRGPATSTSDVTDIILPGSDGSFYHLQSTSKPSGITLPHNQSTPGLSGAVPAEYRRTLRPFKDRAVTAADTRVPRPRPPEPDQRLVSNQGIYRPISYKSPYDTQAIRQQIPEHVLEFMRQFDPNYPDYFHINTPGADQKIKWLARLDKLLGSGYNPPGDRYITEEMLKGPLQ